MGAGILAWSPEDATNPRRIFSCSVHLAGEDNRQSSRYFATECWFAMLVHQTHGTSAALLCWVRLCWLFK